MPFDHPVMSFVHNVKNPQKAVAGVATMRSRCVLVSTPR
jgi:hypothetical protein